MRDRVMEELKTELARRDAYEAQCPTCDICGQKIIDDEYFYDIYGTYVCDQWKCINNFLREYRRSVASYMEER